MTDLQAIYQLPDFDAVDSCDFSKADELGIMNGPGTEGDDGCWAYTFELDHVRSADLLFNLLLILTSWQRN